MTESACPWQASSDLPFLARWRDGFLLGTDVIHNLGVIERPRSMKETGFTEVALRTAAKVFAAAGLLALLFWLGWVMIDVEHMNSGFTLP